MRNVVFFKLKSQLLQLIVKLQLLHQLNHLNLLKKLTKIRRNAKKKMMIKRRSLCAVAPADNFSVRNAVVRRATRRTVKKVVILSPSSSPICGCNCASEVFPAFSTLTSVILMQLYVLTLRDACFKLLN